MPTIKCILRKDSLPDTQGMQSPESCMRGLPIPLATHGVAIG